MAIFFPHLLHLPVCFCNVMHANLLSKTHLKMYYLVAGVGGGVGSFHFSEVPDGFGSLIFGSSTTANTESWHSQ